MQTRRDFLKLAALISGAGFTGMLPASIERAYAIEPEPGSTWLDAEHIVILMQENRSFDHTFGTLRGVRGFNDPRALRLPNGNLVFVQTDQEGQSYAPWRLDIRDTRITWMGSLPHSRESQIDAWNQGRHDGWLDAKRSGDKKYSHVPMTMGYYTREDLPFYYALADAFTVCDQNYCSVLSSTSPNRCYLWTGTIRDRQSPGSKVFIRNEQIDGGGLVWKTFPERLQEAGITWKTYQNDLTRSALTGEESDWLSNFGDNTLECFDAYNAEAYPGFAAAAESWKVDLTEQARKLEAGISAAPDAAQAAQMRAWLKQVQDNIAKIDAALSNCGNKRYQQLTDEQKALFHAAFVTNAGDPDYHALSSLEFEEAGQPRTMRVPKGDIFHQFRKDVQEGKLPTVSWLVAPQNFSDHPTSPWFGAWYVSEAMDILTSNPDVWKKTIFILNYDENDGYFDHAPSFVAADPKRPETGGASSGISTALDYTYIEDELAQGVAPQEARRGPIGLGFRVPMIVASPWTRGGWVNSQVFDHTSTLQLLEHFVEAKYGKSVREENISTWRRTVTGDMTSVFRPFHSASSDLNFVDRDPFVVSIEKARYKEIPNNYRALSANDLASMQHSPRHSALLAKQETGIRHACALPYELYADGSLSQDGKHWELRLTAGDQAYGARSAGAPFNVYLRNLKNGKSMQAATYAVKAGDTLLQKIPLEIFVDSNYDIEIHGPNGFYRSFVGKISSPSPVVVRVAYEQDASRLTGNIEIHLQNKGRKTMAVSVIDQSYGRPSVHRSINGGDQTAIIIPLQSSHLWYDFTIHAGESEVSARYAGRVETGHPGYSDPLMGSMA
ncbi:MULTISPECIES: phosphocholine-specific phospholipase C [Acidobacterium]|uniref:phospholipase C n=1 Tax=Acidobacterium capsulatum (strain ATCC 51196 / DSM 11244 / BCRC 80197 / JCM 7670 / NBRC 15755 / NCIMB 13165 / 161) TaxID=240015 RepID=C1F333_ACIC5|nr:MULTISPECIES: phospholipase C, phosphocholine-specific [Acidobacterium]ACO34429.1 Tat pathway signal sequence domain protein [Acidobacterium capsulatum ATCC 51196]HCT61416.1 phospholipase C, phosphocholine-specific [Acidobacterium sp.]